MHCPNVIVVSMPNKLISSLKSTLKYVHKQISLHYAGSDDTHLSLPQCNVVRKSAFTRVDPKGHPLFLGWLGQRRLSPTNMMNTMFKCPLSAHNLEGSNHRQLRYRSVVPTVFTVGQLNYHRFPCVYHTAKMIK